MGTTDRTHAAPRRPFLWRLGVSAFFTMLFTAALAAGAGAAMRAGWFRLQGISAGELTLYVALAAVAGVLLQMGIAFLLPLVSRGPRVTLRARLKFLLAAPLLVAAAGAAGYLVLPAQQREAVNAAAETLAREAEREAKTFDARAEAERAEADVRTGRAPAPRTIALLLAALALVGALAALVCEIARGMVGGAGREGRAGGRRPKSGPA
jgi:hypothetical protein